MTVQPRYTFQQPEGLLAHYTSVAAVFEHIIVAEGRLRMSPYRKMRDPAENQDIIPGTAWWGNQPGAERTWVDMIDHVKRVRDAMRVLSFTRDAVDQVSSHHGFDCCWARPRMWEQYADVHRGACLLFDRDRLEQALGDKLGDESLYRGDVDYTREGIAQSATQSLIDDRIFDDEQRERAVRAYIDNNRRDFFFLKSDDFETEAEYRIVLKTDDPAPTGYATDDQGYAYVDYGDALVAVVLGLHFPEWQRLGAQESCNRAGVKLLRMWWERGSPFLLGTGESS